MIEISKKGIEVERLDEIVERLSDGYKSIYGANINLDPETPDGQLLGIFAQNLADLGQGFLYLRQQTDPQYATGQWLDQLAAFNNVKRRQAAHSFLRSVILTGKPLTFIEKALRVTDANGNDWKPVSRVQLNGDGSARVDFQSVEYGAFEVAARAELKIKTVILGLEKVVTTNDAEQGEGVESDESLRKRCIFAKETAAQSSIGTMTSNLLRVNEVKKVLVLENYTNETDAQGIEPHTIDVVIAGGDDKEIAETIYRYKDGGCGLQGNTQVDIFADNLTRTIKFDRPALVDVHIKMELERYSLYTEIDKATIIKNLEALDFGIGEDVYPSRLISTINKSPGFTIRKIEVGRSSGSLSSDDLDINVREIARFLESNIQILER